MSVEINYLGVLLAGVSSMVVGSVWYSRSVLGTTWGKLAGIKMEGKPKMAEMAPLLLVQFVLSLLTAYVLAHFVYLSHVFFKNSWLNDSLMTAFWAWLGFTACRLLPHDMFEGRRKKLSLLNLSYDLVTLLVMGLIIGLIHP